MNRTIGHRQCALARSLAPPQARVPTPPGVMHAIGRRGRRRYPTAPVTSAGRTCRCWP